MKGIYGGIDASIMILFHKKIKNKKRLKYLYRWLCGLESSIIDSQIIKFRLFFYIETLKNATY
jgi:hypothetical protein